MKKRILATITLILIVCLGLYAYDNNEVKERLAYFNDIYIKALKEMYLGKGNSSDDKIEREKSLEDIRHDLIVLYEKTNSSLLYPETMVTSKKLCLTQSDIALDGFEPDNKEEAVGLFNITDNTVVAGYNLFQKRYPASTTKIMTALLSIEEGELDSIVTVDKDIKDIDSDSTIAGLKDGDRVSKNDLLYGLMLPSGNDAAIALADQVSGSVPEFANLMNKKALELGATGTHFVNSNGLHDPDHYTTVYDMYLIFREAIMDDKFVEITSSSQSSVTVTGSDGTDRTLTWKNTNEYLNSETKVADCGNAEVVCGKTGTTDEAGCNLVIYVKGSSGDDYIAIIMDAPLAPDKPRNRMLYNTMNQLLLFAE